MSTKGGRRKARHARDRAPDERSLYIEVDGEGASPDNIDSRALLDLVSRYVDAMVALSEANDDDPLRLQGLKVIDKCVAVVMHPSSQVVARYAAGEIADYVGDVDEAPYGLDQRITGLREAVRRLGPARTVKVAGHGWQRIVKPPEQPEPVRTKAVVTLRARPIRSGGVRPKIQFESSSEPERFSLDATEQQIRELAAHMYTQVEIEATVERIDGEIRRGRLDRFRPVLGADPLEPGNALATWRDWFRAEVPGWDDVADVVGEVRRARGDSDDNGSEGKAG